MEIKNIRVSNLDGAIRGMRNPLGSHDLSDSSWEYQESVIFRSFKIGDNDLKLARSLIKAGSDHRKFMRQIFVSFDLSMPEYWWKQYNTYKVATVENSTSQMHTLGKRLLEKEDFCLDEDYPEFETLLSSINSIISEWQISKSKKAWRRLIQIMPQSFVYLKTCTITYETLLNMSVSRKNHKLKEWDWFLDNLIPQCPFFSKLVE